MNSEPSFYSRRALLTVAATMLFVPTLRSRAQTPVAIEVYKDPNCGCCNGWVDHLRRNGFVVSAIDTKGLQAIKVRLGIPPDLASCHTAIELVRTRRRVSPDGGLDQQRIRAWRPWITALARKANCTP